jgi:PKD repeat protein
MPVRRLPTALLLLALLASLPGTVQARAPLPSGQPTALVYVALPDRQALARFAATGLPAYTRPQGQAEQYLLAGADPAGRLRLALAGLSYRVLDSDTRGSTYYFANLMPGRPAPDWSAYGRLLLDDGAGLLLRMAPAAAERLTLAGVELRMLTFDPKPLPLVQEWSAPTVITPDPLIQSMMDQVISTTVYQYDGDLSGEWPVIIGGSPYTITTRNTYSGTPIQKATQFVGEHLQGLGLDVEYHQWGGATYPNVIGELTGLINPDDIFIICGHLDDMPPGDLAPGADDNASGAVATMLAADILSQYQWGCTLRFALWTGEEQGLLGSHAYAQRSYNLGENIVGVLNLDMIAWNTIGSNPDIALHADSGIPPTLELAQLFADVVDAYNLDLDPTIVPNGIPYSDHASFWDYGYTAILGIEDTEYGDFNPNYHTTNDLLEHLDMDYFTDFVKASVGTFAHMSGCLIPGGIGHLDGHVTAATGGAPIAGASVVAEDVAGHSFPATTDGSGYYTRTLIAGTYTVTASAYGYLPATVSGVDIVTDTVTTRDFALEPIVTTPTIVVSPTLFDVALEQNLVATETLTVGNEGAADLGFTLTEAPAIPWLAENPVRGTVPPAASTPVSIIFDARWVGPGIYTTTLEVHSNDPETPLVPVAVTLTVAPPCDAVRDAAFTWAPPTPTVGQAITFTGSATGTPPITYTWDFGDSSVVDGPSSVVTHTYTLPGPYTVTLTASNCATATATVAHTITVAPSIPPCEPVTATAFTWTPLTPTVGQVITFTGSATGTPPITYTWDFGDSSVVDGPSSVVTHTYALAGPYTITLAATNGCGQATRTHAIVVVPSRWEVYLPLVFR